MRRRALRAGLAAGLATLLAGCGFALRRAPLMPFRSIALAGFAPRSPLAAALREELLLSSRVLEAPAQAEVVLQALNDTREKSVVAFTAAGQVRELQLRLKLGFRVVTPAGRELVAPAELLLTRDLSYNETEALGKAFEEAELYRDMQAEVVTQVMQRLAALKP